MKTTLQTILIVFLQFFCILSEAGTRETELTEYDRIVWDTSLTLPSIPGNNACRGVAGAFSGKYERYLIIAGGSNFPGGTDSVKVYYNDAFLYDTVSGEWSCQEDVFPENVAYGVSVSVPEGLLCIGGCNGNDCFSSVRLLKVLDGKVVISEYPPLPVPLAECAGALCDNRVYIAGGFSDAGTRKPVREFHMLDLSSVRSGWNRLPAWNGPARVYPVAVSQSNGTGNCFWLFSGRDITPSGEWNVLDDGYMYIPWLGTWERLEGRFNVMAGSACASGSAHILFFGGRDSLNRDTGNVCLYHTVTGTMEERQSPVRMPVTTNVIKDGNDIYITGGETSPGVRTPEIVRGRMQTSLRHLGVWDIVVIILYFVVLAFIGWYFSGRQKSSSTYFKGGGRMPWFVVGLSIFGTALSAITFMAIPAKAYATDWSYILFNSGIILVVPIIVSLFIPYFRKINITTAYEYLELRFNSLIRVICSMAFILFQIGRMGIVLLLPAIALNVVSGMDIFLCILLMGGLSLIYTTVGGIEAVVWSDALQVVVLLGAAITIMVMVCVDVPGGFCEIVDTAETAGKFSLGDIGFDLRKPTVWTTLIAAFFTNLTTYGTDQTIVQRYLTVESREKANRSVYVNALLTVPASLIFFFVGTAIWVFFKNYPMELNTTIADGDAILPWYVSIRMPNGVFGLVIAGIFAAAMSTLSSSMNSAATAFVTDIYRKITPDRGNGLKIAKLMTLFIGAAGILFALLMATWDIKSLWDEFNKILGLLLGGLGGLFILGMVTKRANSTGALIGLGASVVVQVLVARYQVVNVLLYSTTGFFSCLIVGYLASLVFSTSAGKKIR